SNDAPAPVSTTMPDDSRPTTKTDVAAADGRDSPSGSAPATTVPRDPRDQVAPPPGAPAAAPPAEATPAEHTYDSSGGSITVRLEKGALTLVSTQPARGFGEDRRDTGPARVEVRFRDAGTEWRIRVEAVDGRAVPEITRH